VPSPPKWKRKIDSPVVEAAIGDFIVIEGFCGRLVVLRNYAR